ncbi:MAG: hypothetical protein V4487_09045 [Chlamydiota bacterium]
MDEEAPPPRQPLFSEESLDKLSSGEQIDRLIHIITPKGWIALLSLFGLITAGIIWALFGKIPIEVHGKGIIFTERGVFSIDNANKGITKEVFIQAGDWVSPNMVIARLEDPNLEIALFTAKEKMDYISAFFEDFKKKISLGKTEVEAYQELVRKYRLSIDQQMHQVEMLEANEEVRLGDRDEALDELELLLREVTPSNYIPFFQDHLFHMMETYSKLTDQKRGLDIHPPSEGQIIEMYIVQGDWLNPGDPVALVKYPLAPGESHVCYAYFPVSEGERIFPGMDAKIGVENVDDKVYGFLLGKVKQVSDFPSSDLALINRIRNPQLVSFLKQGATTIVKAIIEPIRDPKTASGYAWTTGKGPPQYLIAGVTCNVRINIETKRPVSYLLPQLFLKPSQVQGPNPDVFPKK